MLRKGVTVREATEKWISEFNRFPQDMIQKLMLMDVDSWHEITVPSCGDKVHVFVLPNKDIYGKKIDAVKPTGEIMEYLEKEERYRIKLDNEAEIIVKPYGFEVERYDVLPMWEWMWQFGYSYDDDWLEEKDGIRMMSECGFRIYKHDEWGYFFGIEGAGYDFYEEHWIPLYRKRGLQLHDSETEGRDS